MSRPTPSARLRPLVALTGSLALAAATLAATPAANAHPSHHPGHSQATPVVVAQALNAPRLLSFDRAGNLYVAEAGSGGTGPCTLGGDGSTVCLGFTGSITRISHGYAKRIVTGLPSLAGANGDEPIGPEAVLPERGRLVVSMGAGIDADQRATLGWRARSLGTLLSVTPWGRYAHHWTKSRVIADIAAFELANNPDNSVAHDSDPAGFLATRHGYVVADAGGNDLLGIHHDDVDALAVFPSVLVDLPPELGGGQAPMQAVPTAVAQGPDGALYVSQLTGFPFPPGGANIWRIQRGHAPTVYASGLTNVTDLAWDHHRLYAVQLADGGLLNATGLPMGSLVRVHPGDNSTPDQVATDLPAPYGVALRNHAAYVTACTVCVGGGQVLRIPLG